jgi:hypothetical protein
MDVVSQSCTAQAGIRIGMDGLPGKTKRLRSSGQNQVSCAQARQVS